MIFTDAKNNNSNISPNSNEYDSLMKETKKWAKKVGIKQSDIDITVKSVRKKKSRIKKGSLK